MDRNGPRGGTTSARPGAPTARRVGGAEARPPEPRTGQKSPEYTDVGQIVERSTVEVDGQAWERLMVRTHVIQPGEDVIKLLERYASSIVRPGDWVAIGQKAVSIAQGRLVREKSVKPRKLAVFLSGKVKRTQFGFGLGRPATMEVALREAGVTRILAACAVHVAGRALRRSGDFYRVAGPRVAAIDGATAWALPPFNEYIVLYPDAPDATCRRAAARIGAPVAIVDLNDLGGTVLGSSPGVDRTLLCRVVADNPLGQGPYCTPLAVVRPVSSSAAQTGPTAGAARQ